MRNRILRNRCLTGLIVLALIAGCFQLKTYWWQPVTTVHAQDDDDDDGLSGGALAVLILGIGGAQKMRLSVAPIPGARQMHSWYLTVRDTKDNVIFRSERIEVPSGEWRFADVPREALRTEGQPGTGEAQVMVQVFVDLPEGGSASDFVGAAQVLDQATGESSTNLRLTFRPAP